MRKHYTVEFKKQAVELARSLDSFTEASKQLGVSDFSIRQWDKNINLKTPTGFVRSSEAEENIRLRKEIAELKKVNYILKAAAAFFSQDHLK